MPSQNYHAVLDRIAEAIERLADVTERAEVARIYRPVPYWPAPSILPCVNPPQYPYTVWSTTTSSGTVDSSGTNG